MENMTNEQNADVLQFSLMDSLFFYLVTTTFYTQNATD